MAAEKDYIINENSPCHPDSPHIRIRLSKYIFYNFLKLLGSDSASLLTGWFPILFRVSVIHTWGLTSASLQEAKKEYIMAILFAPHGNLQIRSFSSLVPEV
jgi:hypothetical protein